MLLQKFSLISIHHGIDPYRLDQNHEEELQNFLDEHLRFQQHDREAVERPVYFKFKAYEPYSFTMRISSEGEASNPYLLLRFRAEVLLGQDMETYINACYQREKRAGYPSPGQRRLEDTKRNNAHIRLASRLTEIFKAHNLVFEGVEEKDIIPKMRILIARMAQFHPKLEMRAPNSDSVSQLRNHMGTPSP